jgi:hypothetical protein
MFSRQPVTRVDDHVLNQPRRVVEEKVLDVTDIGIRRLDVVTCHFRSASQMRIRSRFRVGWRKTHLYFELIATR